MAALTLPPPRLAEYGASLAATALFGANVYFWRTTDYFATAAEDRPLLHMWSLAVEEQFYIFFPLLLLALWCLGNRWRRTQDWGGSDTLLWVSFLVMAVISFALSVVLADWKPAANFYLPITRAWELLAGSLIALLLKGTPPARTFYAPWLAGFGFVIVMGALISIENTTLWPGPWTLVPVVGTALILAFARADCPTGRVLGWTPMVWIGLLSYSIYLWHQPLLAFARITSLGEPPIVLMAALALATVPLAWMSWRFIEQPFRTRHAMGGFSRRTVFIASGAALMVITAVGLVPVTASQLTQAFYMARLSDDAHARYIDLQDIIEPARPTEFDDTVDSPCRERFDMVTQDARDMLLRCTENGQRAVIVTGGSHAIDLYVALSEASETDVILAFARGYCRPHRRLGSARPHECPFDGLLDLVAIYPDHIALVIYTQAGFTVLDDYRNVRSAEGLHVELIEEVGDYLKSLSLHVPVLALGPKPFLGADPRALSLSHPFEIQIASLQDPGIDVAMSAVDQAFARTFDQRGIPYLSHADTIKSVLPADAILEGKLTYRDNDHWSTHGARVFGARLIAVLQAEGYRDLFPTR